MEAGLSRRRLLAGIGGIGLALPFGRQGIGATTTETATLGLQTITVMNLLAVDMPGTLAGVARAGYRQLETVGALGVEPSVLADRLAIAGLSTNAQHLCPASFYPVMAGWSRGTIPMADVAMQLNSVYALDRLPAILDECIATAKILGQRYLIWSSLPVADLADAAGLSRIVRAFDDAGRTCAREGLVFGFHNGSRGFTPVAGTRPYDLLLAETDPALVKMELDLYWAVKVGIDPRDYLSRHPGRFALCHLKNMDSTGNIAPVGPGRIDFAAIIPAARRAGIGHFYFEYDQAPDPMRAITDAHEVFAPMMR